MPTCAFLSFRLGDTDGVSGVAAKWQEQFSALGWETFTVAGPSSGQDDVAAVDVAIEGLELGAQHAPDVDELRAALARADLVVVENLLTIPMNLPASRVAIHVLRGRPAVLHHHDPPWQRAHFAHITELPPVDPLWHHVTINRLTEAQFAERGIKATTIYNGFDATARLGDRSAMRVELEVADDERLVVHPARAIPRKDVGAAISLAEQLNATYWLTGPAEDGYDDELDRLFQSATCRIIHRKAKTIPELYAAADVVAFPSTWEGFGNPPIEASIHHRPVAVGPYPVREELTELGFEWFESDDVDGLEAELQAPDLARRERNRARAQEHLSVEALRNRLEDLLDKAGWGP